MRGTWKAVVALCVISCGNQSSDRPGDTGGGIASAGPGDDAAGSSGDAGDDAESESGAPETTGDDDDSGFPDDPGGVFDVGSSQQDCDNAGQPSFSYLWVANSPQGTISKINTETLQEEGRYYVRPDHDGSPSRTSVNLDGDVVVASRHGGITKIYADPAKCAAGATSSGANDIKPFPDPCVAWYTEMNYSSQRGVAWIPADYDQTNCEYADQKLWTTGTSGQVEVVLVDGETGVVEDTVAATSVNGGGYGVYGAAVDGAGNFWGWVPSGNDLLYVDRQNLTHQAYGAPAGGYGIAVDKAGRPWLCAGSVSRFDPTNQTWETQAVGGGAAGCMEDGLGTLWVSAGGGLRGIDIETLATVQDIDTPAFIKGISVQPTSDGKVFVWGVTQGQFAFKADPQTGQLEAYQGLTNPYTYSDMTGFGLYNAGQPSG